jgi:hypothetical protein
VACDGATSRLVTARPSDRPLTPHAAVWLGGCDECFTWNGRGLRFATDVSRGTSDQQGCGYVAVGKALPRWLETSGPRRTAALVPGRWTEIRFVLCRHAVPPRRPRADTSVAMRSATRLWPCFGRRLASSPGVITATCRATPQDPAWTGRLICPADRRLHVPNLEKVSRERRRQAGEGACFASNDGPGWPL